jgi:short-subunit dehydrogenase
MVSAAEPRGIGIGLLDVAQALATFLGSATLATYSGAKALSRIFSEALWAECRPMGIDALHMVINFTDTPAMDRAGVDTSTAQTSDEGAQEALDNMRNGPLLILGGQRGLDMASKPS